MKIEYIDTHPLTVGVNYGQLHGWRLLRRLTSLLLVTHDCAANTIVHESAGNLPRAVARSVRELVERVRNVRYGDGKACKIEGDEFGFYLIGRDRGFLCLRDAGDVYTYSIYIAATGQNVYLASRCAYIISDVFGLPSMLAFEIRFCVYELLNNILEHGLKSDDSKWIQVVLSRKEGTIEVTIVDKGTKFDPTGDVVFDLNSYLESGKRRGLGLIMTRKISGKLLYEREYGFNRITFEKEIPNDYSIPDIGKEDEMEQFVVGEPRRLEDGFYMIELEGDLDTKGALVMEDLLTQLLEQKMYSVVLDFKKVPFVSSAGVGMLLGMVSSLRDEGGDVKFINVTPKIISVLRLLNLDDFFAIKEFEGSIIEY
ncbi:MAG: anti-sigma factor antagonist [bacterium]|nr:MAG: anti-sigma factor antagonist [bacterium]